MLLWHGTSGGDNKKIYHVNVKRHNSKFSRNVYMNQVCMLSTNYVLRLSIKIIMFKKKEKHPFCYSFFLERSLPNIRNSLSIALGEFWDMATVTQHSEHMFCFKLKPIIVRPRKKCLFQLERPSISVFKTLIWFQKYLET
jgi:hypothetical protein